MCKGAATAQRKDRLRPGDRSHYPRVSLHWIGEWYVDAGPSTKVDWGPFPLDKDLSLRTADRLSQDTAITEAIILSDVFFDLETDLIRGCWILWHLRGMGSLAQYGTVARR